MKILLAGIILFFSFSAFGLNKENPVNIMTKEEALPSHVKHIKVFGIIDRVQAIDLSEGSFEVEAEILLKWQNDKDREKIISLFKERTYAGKHVREVLDQIWHPEFLVKSEIVRRETLFTTLHLNEDGSLELFEKFATTLPINTDIASYPFGSLKLNMNIVAFTHDTKEMTLDPVYFKLGHDEQEEPIFVGPWHLLDSYVDKSVSHRLSSTDQTYSQIGFHLIIEHDFHDSVQKIFFPLSALILVSMVLNLFSSMRYEKNVTMRVGGQMTLLLTLFALRFSLGGEIPSTHYLNLVDWLFIVGLGAVFTNFLSTIVLADKYSRYGDTEELRRLETRLDRAVPLITLMLTLGLFVFMLNFA